MQCQGLEIDGRSDIYSMGCLIYETLAGKPPFAGNTLLETMSKHLAEEVPEIKALSKDMNQILRKTLAKKAEDRFQTASELKAALLAAKKETESATTVSRFPSTWPVILLLSAGLILVLLASKLKDAGRSSDIIKTPEIKSGLGLGKQAALVFSKAQHEADPQKAEKLLLEAATLAAKSGQAQEQMLILGTLVAFYNDKVAAYNKRGWFIDAPVGRKDEKSLSKQLELAKRLLESNPGLKQDKTALKHTISVANAVEICAENSILSADQEYFLKHAYNILVSDSRNRDYRDLFEERLEEISRDYLKVLRKDSKIDEVLTFEKALKLRVPTSDFTSDSASESASDSSDLPAGLISSHRKQHTLPLLNKTLRLEQTDPDLSLQNLLISKQLAKERKESGYQFEAIAALAVFYHDSCWWLAKDVHARKNKEEMKRELLEARKLLAQNRYLRNKYERENTVQLAGFMDLCAGLADSDADKLFFFGRAYNTLIEDKRNERDPKFKHYLTNIGSGYAKLLLGAGRAGEVEEVKKTLLRYKCKLRYID